MSVLTKSNDYLISLISVKVTIYS